MMKKILIVLLFLGLAATSNAATKRVQDYDTLAAPATGDWLFVSDLSASGREYKIPISAIFGTGITASLSPTFANQYITDYTYYTSDDATHWVAFAAANNTTNILIRLLAALPASGTEAWMVDSLGNTSTADVVFGDNTIYSQDATPATCNVGDLFVDTNATSGAQLYACESANTWVAQAGGGGTGDDLGSATAADIIALFNTGSCSGYLKSDGTCDTPSGAAHDAVTLGVDVAPIFSLTGQQLDLDSQTANYIFAAPNGSPGDPTFRAMVDGDIPSTIARDTELPTASSLSVDDLITLSGVATGAVNLGSFTGTTIADNVTNKAALQALETSVEGKQATLTNPVVQANLGTGVYTFLGTPTAANFWSAVTGEGAFAATLFGYADAATTFSGIKQAASESATGVVELATTAEATTGTDTSRAVTPAGVKAVTDQFWATGTDGTYGLLLNNNSASYTCSAGVYGINSIAGALYYCHNGTNTALPTGGFANPMTTAGDMIKGGTAGAATRMVPGTGVVAALEANTNGAGGFITRGNAAGTAAVLTGYSSGAGAVAATDTILQAINKLNGNTAAKANSADAVLTSSTKLPNGANPTTDAAGEIAIDSSAGAGQGIRAYGAVAFTLPAYQTKCTTINAATASSDFMAETLPYAITIRAAHVNQIGATNVIGHFDECDSAGANCATIDSTADITATTTKANDDGTLSNPSIDAGDVISWHTTSVSGTNTQLMVCFDYTVDQVN